VFLVFLMMFSNVWLGPRPAQASPSDPPLAKVAVNPSSIASLNFQSGNTVTFQLNVTDVEPFGGFIVAVFFNNSVLHFSGLDFSGGILGNDALVLSECVDGLNVPGGNGLCFADVRFDRVGVVSLTLATNSGLNKITADGKLFSVIFTVATVGFSTIHFVDQELLTEPDGTPLQSVSYDGYFTNIDCPLGSGNLCKPPLVSFTHPSELGINQPASFNAIAVSQNRNGVIREYNWTWGSGLDKRHYDSPAPGTATPSPNATLRFPDPGINQVTLSAQDNYGARAYYSLSIFVFRTSGDVLGFFTDASLIPLPYYQGWPRVDVVLANGVVRSTDPRHVLAWISVTNTGERPLQSLKLNGTLPVDWAVDPVWMPGKGAIHVYYANTSSLATNPEITDPSTITVTIGNPQTVLLAIPNLNATGIGHPLLPGRSILLSVKLSYDLIKTSQSPASYPRVYYATATATTTVGWTHPSYAGAEAIFSGRFFLTDFVAYADIVGTMLVPYGSLTVRAVAYQKDWIT
jgi:hypothetical protein